MSFHEIEKKGKEGESFACRVKRSSEWLLWSPEGSQVRTGPHKVFMVARLGGGLKKNVNRFWRLVKDEFWRWHLKLEVVTTQARGTYNSLKWRISSGELMYFYTNAWELQHSWTYSRIFPGRLSLRWPASVWTWRQVWGQGGVLGSWAPSSDTAAEPRAWCPHVHLQHVGS